MVGIFEPLEHDKEAAEAGWKVVVHLGGGGDSGDGVWANGNLHLAKVECGCAVYCNAITYGLLWGGGEEAGGGYAVVGTGGNWPERGKGDCSGDDGGGKGWYVGINRGGLIRKTPGVGTTSMDTK